LADPTISRRLTVPATWTGCSVSADDGGGGGSETRSPTPGTPVSGTSSGFRLACVQMDSGNEIAPNVEIAAGLIRESAKQGADFISLPE
jgi:hypothetical protein